VSAEDWVRAALRALGRDGVAGVRVEVLARELGVTKGSYYHHFRNRRGVLLAALETWEQVATEQVIDQVEAQGDLRTRTAELLRVVFADGGEHDAIESGIRAWASTDEGAGRVVARVDERRIGYVASLLEAQGVAEPRLRSELVYRALIGEFVWRTYGGPALQPEALDLLLTMVLDS